MSAFDPFERIETLDLGRRERAILRRKKWFEDAQSFWLNEYAEEGDDFANKMRDALSISESRIEAPLHPRYRSPTQ